jgi:hypothetical protein
MSTRGSGLKQIVLNPAGLPGAANSCYSALQTISVNSTTDGSGATVITDIGELLFMPMASTNMKVQLQVTSGSWTTLFNSTTAAAQFFSDGTNLRFNNADTTTTRSGTYYIIQ